MDGEALAVVAPMVRGWSCVCHRCGKQWVQAFASQDEVWVFAEAHKAEGCVPLPGAT